MPKDERIISQNEFISQATNDKVLEDEYNPDEHLDDGSFKRMGVALWLAENRRKITKIFIGFLITISASFFTYSIYNLVIYFRSGDPTKQIVEGNLNPGGQKQTEDLIFSEVSVFKGGEKNDLAVKIKNPNDKFSATFKYCFMVEGEEVFCGEDFVLPEEEKFISALGVSNGFSSASFAFRTITWKRLDTKAIPDFVSFKSSRLSFPVSDLVFSPAASGISSNIDLNWLEFSILNNTSYGYYEVPLDILIFKSGTLVGINRHILNNFTSGDSRSVRMTWPGDLRGAKDVQVIPAVNVLDDSVYLKYQGSQTN